MWGIPDGALVLTRAFGSDGLLDRTDIMFRGCGFVRMLADVRSKFRVLIVLSSWDGCRCERRVRYLCVSMSEGKHKFVKERSWRLKNRSVRTARRQMSTLSR